MKKPAWKKIIESFYNGTIKTDFPYQIEIQATVKTKKDGTQVIIYHKPTVNNIMN
jgi:hypothetical protein